MKQILFFALREDILQVLESVESFSSLRYIRAGQLSEPHAESFALGGEIPNLGKATAESAINSESFLIVEQGALIKYRSIRAANGDERFCVDQLVNPDSITFTSGGIWMPDIVLHGRVATISESEMSKVLMKRFNSAFRKSFSKTKAFWVGEKARAMLDSGARLTISAQSSRDFDLTP